MRFSKCEFLDKSRIFAPVCPNCAKSSDLKIDLLVIWTFLPSPIGISHGSISIRRLHQTLQNTTIPISPFSPIDISHSWIRVRGGLRKVAWVVSIRIVTCHVLKKKEIDFCLTLKSLLLLGSIDVNSARKSAWKVCCWGSIGKAPYS